MQKDLVSIENLSVGFPAGGAVKPALKDVSLKVRAGEILALVGESGSGKTLVSKAIMQLMPETAHILSGSIRYDGEDVLAFKGPALQAFRGAKVGMVFQEPLTSLNPAVKVGVQLMEGLKLHTNMPDAEIYEACLEMLSRVKLADPKAAMNRYPHEFSGGMRQRIMLASVMLLKPALLIADEPTTALDVMIQKEILDIMTGLVREEGTALLLITHDLALVSAYADYIAVMEKGQLVEEGVASDVLNKPTHPYTQKLLASVPGQNRHTAAGVVEDTAASLLEARDICVTFSDTPLLWWNKRTFHAVKTVSLSLRKRETLALVGESGSGKTTLGRAILGLVEPSAGEVFFEGEPLASDLANRAQAIQTSMQLVFQDPFSSLNPRLSVGAILKESLRRDKGLTKGQKDTLVAETLEAVGLPSEFHTRLPHELSGGQRQRISIARALITNPQIVIADEAVSALDVTVQAQVLDLLRDLQKSRGFGLLFITHDLAVVEEIADRVMVMYHGHIVEEGNVAQVFDTPAHPYTQALLSAAPRMDTKTDKRVFPKPVLPPGVEPVPLETVKDSGMQMPGQFQYELTLDHKISVYGPRLL